MEAFADVIERWVPLRKGHITTRQNIQLHHVPLADAAELIRELGEAGLSSREGCGNTVRNVTADPYAGVADRRGLRPDPLRRRLRPLLRPPPGHPGDAAQVEDRLLRLPCRSRDRPDPRHRLPPRCSRDGERGFEVWVGGGTAIMPRLAHKIYDFVGADDGSYLKVTEAIVRIFDRQDWLRKNRARARIKVLLDKIGPDAFRALVDEELEGDWTGERDYAAELARLRFDDDEEARVPPPATVYGSPNGDRTEFDLFRERNVSAAAPARLLRRRREGRPAATSRRSSSAASPRSCASSAAATPAPRSSRT